MLNLFRVLAVAVSLLWCGSAGGQVVLDMPAPPAKRAPGPVSMQGGDVEPEVRRVEPGEVALARYAVGHSRPRVTTSTYHGYASIYDPFFPAVYWPPIRSWGFGSFFCSPFFGHHGFRHGFNGFGGIHGSGKFHFGSGSSIRFHLDL